MGLPFFNKKSRKSDHIIAIDLGSRATKAVYLQRQGDGFNLAGVAIVEAPGLGEKQASPELLAEHLKSVYEQLGAKTKQIILAVGVQESLLRLTELPMLPVTEMRTMLKYGSKNYLKEELNGHVFDCHPMPLRQAPDVDPEKKIKPGSIKQPVVVGGIPEQRLNDLVNAVKLAGLTLEAVVPGHIGPANAFEMSDSETFHNEVVALVEVGFKNSCISILHNGALVLNRVVGVGGDKLTNGLAETLSISYEEAEGIKIGMPNEVQSTLESLLLPLGRELRASADFFENQNEKPVTQILVSGGCACSEFLAQMLQNELMSPCKNWDPSRFLNNTLSPEQREQFEPNVARLSVAIGAAATAF
jgi:type IV pilus assembly protein PilM